MTTPGKVINVPCEVFSVYHKAGTESVVAYLAVGDCQEPVVSEGDVILIDKELLPKNGNLVLCMKDGHETGKRYVQDKQGNILLCDNYGKYSMEGYTIIGVAVELHKRLE